LIIQGADLFVMWEAFYSQAGLMVRRSRWSVDGSP